MRIGLHAITHAATRCGVLAFTVLTGSIASWQSPRAGVCDDEVTPQAGPLGYAWRDNRCEGLIAQNIVTTVRLKSLMAKGPDAAAPAQRSARLPPSAPAGGYHMRMWSLDPSVRYQLDARLSPSAAFTWQPLAGTVDRQLVGALAWSLGTTRLYVPVALDASSAAAFDRSRRVIAIVESTVPIVKYVAHLRAAGSPPGSPLQGDSPLPARLLELSLPRGATPARTQLWFTAQLLGEPKAEPHVWDVWVP